MPIHHIVVLRNVVRRAPPAGLEARLATKRNVPPTGRASAAAVLGPVSPRAENLRLKAVKQEERAAAARARVAAKENAVRAAMEHRLEVASELKQKTLNSTVTKARDVSQKVKAVRLRSQRAEAEARAAKERALQAELARGAALHLAAVEERKWKAHAANARVSAVHDHARDVSRTAASVLMSDIEMRQEKATQNRIDHLCQALAGTIRHSFRVAAVSARKNLADSLEATTGKHMLETSLEHASRLRQATLDARREKAKANNAKAARASTDAKQHAALRSQEILERTAARMQHADEIKARRHHVTLRKEFGQTPAAMADGDGEQLSPCGEFVMEPEGGWHAAAAFA